MLGDAAGGCLGSADHFLAARPDLEHCGGERAAVGVGGLLGIINSANVAGPPGSRSLNVGRPYSPMSAAVAGLVFLLSGCGPAAGSSAASAQSPSEEAVLAQASDEATAIVETETIDADQSNHTLACRGTIAAVLGRPFTTVQPVSGSQGDEPLIMVRYERRDDGTEWTNRCQIQGNRVIWSRVDGDRIEPWRTGPNREAITYERSEDELIIRRAFPGGDTQTHTFPIMADAETGDQDPGAVQ